MGATSKISKYADINQLKTKGFRGKALFSISKLCDLKISTKIQSSDSGYELFFEKEGAKFTEKIVVMTTGTKVEVRELYCTLPVRKKDLETKIRSYFSKCLIYLQHMCLLHLDIRFQIHNKKRNVDKEIILATLHNNSLTSTIIRIFSLKSKNSLVEIKDSNEFTYRGKSYSFAIEGILNCEKSSNSNTNSDSSFLQQRHFFFLNRRIWTNLKLVKRINKILLNFVEKRNMYAVLFISTTASCDFNVSTNKEKIYVEYEDELIDFIVKKIESDITTFFVSQRQTYPTSSSQTIIESFAEVNSSIKSANNSANSILENSFVDDLSNYPSSTQIVGGNDQKIMQQSTLSQSPNLQKYKFLKNTQPLPSVPTNYLKHFMDRKQESNNINDVFSMHCVPSKISIDIDSLK
ncbi:MAG: Mismatch repair endonuclease pms2, variant 2, partial [Marteilia pararefringens]